MKPLIPLVLIALAGQPSAISRQASHLVVRDGNEAKLKVIVEALSSSSLSDKDKFHKVISNALAMNGSRSSGPDSLFKRYPNWWSYLMIFTENYEVHHWAPEYQNADLTFLKKWVELKGPSQLRTFMKQLGYLDADGFPKRKRIAPAHLEQILRFSEAIYDQSASNA